MYPLSKFPPVDLNDFDVLQKDWISGPCGLTSRSDALTRSNFEALLDRLDGIDPYGDTWEIVRFPHWDVEWVELAFVKPESAAYYLCVETLDALNKFGILDDQLFLIYKSEEDAECLKDTKSDSAG